MGVFQKTVWVMGQSEASHIFLKWNKSTCDTDIRLALVLTLILINYLWSSWKEALI